MQISESLFKKLLKDVKVKIGDEFDRNFERKAFFDRQWPARKREGKGSLMNVRGGGGLRGSLNSKIIGRTEIEFYSSLPYAEIHNEGGTIPVTLKMKKFFWYRYRMATGGDNKVVNSESQFWKAMALKRVGSAITIPKRQFIGWHPIVDQNVKQITVDWFNTDVKEAISKQLKKRIR